MIFNEPQRSLDSQPEFAGHSESELRDLFDEVSADSFIEEHRQLDSNHRLDIEQSAATIPAKIKYIEPIGRRLATFEWPNGDFVISITPEASFNQRRFLLGHEMGHYALFMHSFEHTGSARLAWQELFDQRRWRAEAFCDYFSLRMNGFSEIGLFTSWDDFPEITE